MKITTSGCADIDFVLKNESIKHTLSGYGEFFLPPLEDIEWFSIKNTTNHEISVFTNERELSFAILAHGSWTSDSSYWRFAQYVSNMRRDV